MLTFKINNLPRSDDANLSVFIEKKIGNDGVWKGVSEEAANNYHDYYKVGEGEYAYEQLWNESYAWEPQTPVFFRVKVTLYDETFSFISESAWSNIASSGVTLAEENPVAPSEVVSPDPAESPAPAEDSAPVANTGNILDDVPKTGDSTVGLLLPVGLMGVAFLGCAILLWRKEKTVSELGNCEKAVRNEKME